MQSLSGIEGHRLMFSTERYSVHIALGGPNSSLMRTCQKCSVGGCSAVEKLFCNL